MPGLNECSIVRHCTCGIGPPRCVSRHCDVVGASCARACLRVTPRARSQAVPHSAGQGAAVRYSAVACAATAANAMCALLSTSYASAIACTPCQHVMQQRVERRSSLSRSWQVMDRR